MAWHPSGPGQPSGPSVVAHRGSSQVNAEHTLGAYIAALQEGADGLECDVRLTADGHLVCVHDRRIDRITGTRGLVSTMDLAQLDELDFATWKNPWADLDDEAPDLDEEHRKVLTLDRLCAAVADFDRRVELAIETKHPTRYAGLVERRVVELLDRYGWASAGSPARVMSFSWMALNRVRRWAPDLEVVLLVDRSRAWQVTRVLASTDWIAGPGMALLREKPHFGRRLAESGRRIYVWTVNTEADLEICLELGVDAVITDVPGLTRRWLEQRV